MEATHIALEDKTHQWFSNEDLSHIMDMMEKMAGAPREDGTYERQPGERNSYELHNQRMYEAKVKAATMAQVP